jgi:N-acetylmuramoyl-L-alanine amidase
VLALLAVASLTLAPAVWTPLAAQTPAPYTVYTSDGRSALPVRAVDGTELVALDRVAELFGLTVSEDPRVEGLTLLARDQRITLIPNQSFVSVGGRIDSLSAPVRRERGVYLVPIDFLSRAVGRALGQRVEVRRDSRVIVVGAVRVPLVTPRFQRVGPRARLDIAIEPATPHQVTREGDRIIVQFDAAALDVARLSGADPEFITGTRVTDGRLELDLGPAVASYRATSAPDDSSLGLDLVPASTSSPTPAPPAPAAAGPPPVVDLAAPAILKTVAIDPGHGGADAGVRGPGGTLEKTLTLQIATRLRTAIESRLGLRVLLTREADIDVPIDRRSALANNNKADLFISLHANASMVASVSGAQVATLNLEAYRDRNGSASGPGIALPLVGGGARFIEAVPWDLAQLPFADRSTAVGQLLVRQLGANQVPLYRDPDVAVPLRGLVGANMPAVLIEMGFLSNPADERALTGSARSGAIIDAIVATIGDMRRRPPVPSGGGDR